jgi:hypothetical protein
MSNLNFYCGHLRGILLKNENCLTCEAVLPNIVGNLADHALKQLWPIALLPRLSPVWLFNLSMLNLLGQTQDCP